MKFSDKQAVGIYISQKRISIVLMKAGQKGLELVKSASAATPEGALKGGNIEDAGLIAGVIRDLKRSNKIRARTAAVSLYARPAVIQIMDMPKQVPCNVRQYVSGEIKNCAVLPSRDIILDYCVVGRRTADRKVLTIAAEEAKMHELVRLCATAGFTVEIIEPAIVSYLRAIYSKRAVGKSGTNVMVAIVNGESMTLSVLRNGSPDFIRVKETPKGEKTPEELLRWLTEEISEVIKFYDIEVVENAGKWEITVFTECGADVKILEQNIKEKIKSGLIQVRTTADAWLDTSIKTAAHPAGDGPNPVATGLALRLLKEQGGDTKVNLVPVQVLKVREARRDILIAANTVAVIWLILILAVSGFSLMIEKVTRSTVTGRRLIERQDNELLLQQHRKLDGRLAVLTARLNRLSEISASYNDVNMADLLDDIRNSTPGSVMITSISYANGARVTLEGLAMSNEAVDIFVGLLEKSRVISTVTLLEARKQDGPKNLITYQISCKLRNAGRITSE